MGTASWTAEMVDELSKLSRNPMLSAAGIARRLNERFNASFTRNAVVGALNRRGLRMAGVRRVVRHRREAVEKPSKATDLAAEEFPNRIPLMAARNHHCRWPAADDGSASMVCGAPIHDRSYCHHHYTRSVRSRQP